MRAHEKMLLNSKLMKANPCLRHWADGSGCAIGMIEGPDVTINSINAPTSAENLYPWLRMYAELPCECPPGEHPWEALTTITHIFNQHVFGRKDWTIERLADYIKSIDPTVDQDEELICEQGEVNAEVKA